MTSSFSPATGDPTTHHGTAPAPARPQFDTAMAVVARAAGAGRNVAAAPEHAHGARLRILITAATNLVASSLETKR